MKKIPVNVVIPAVAAVVALGAVAFATALPRHPPGAERRAIADADRIRTDILSRIEHDGLERTYADLKNERKDDQALHGDAHIFGELAYKKEGIAAIRYCDNAMTFGCYHGLIVRALVTEGLDALPKIDAACKAAHGDDDTGCRHGIGHGLVEFFGPKDLGSALDRCASIQRPGLLGCAQGAFMDYSNAAADDPSLVDRKDLDQPCTSVAPPYRAACYFEQPYFWMLRADLGSAAAMDRCAALADPALKESCLLGFGRATAELGRYDMVAIDRECARLRADDRIGCLAGARWLFAATKKARPWPGDGLPAKDAASCSARSKAISDVGQ
ncbi:MAG TPA: hypothetical protein VL426_00480 [Candidatus Binatia bacterium]|nr:hypothetical protein [Candidatus Binatia bacterium]